ncbi:SigE family RNA polymerase sigma factor [Actinospica durhamensis]|uniref:SigE family RNA polymerase sigma factor n=1 Tax=Actinospica durhamensis TaxID=1508375 RepID=A0A941ERS0_9ACTN|nr:SigE family RNA polymerase sigma factor [Actinospica durhamensis]MBR7836275.1 SigE family RNA polymerase sigma factor [Actinospica durhamensis]
MTDTEYAAFVAANWDRYLRVAYLLTGTEHAAEELLQDTLVKLYSRWRRVSAIGDPNAYVRRMLANGNVSRWRRSRREHLVDVAPEAGSAAAGRAGGGADGRQEPGGRDHAVDLRRALMRLPAGQRAVAVLRHFEDLSEKQVAEVLGCSVGTVKSQNAKALAGLRQHLDAYFEETRSLL